MGWLGDGDSHVDDQAGTLAAGTLTWQFGDVFDRNRVTDVMADALQDLENHGLAELASPYRLTSESWRTPCGIGRPAPSFDWSKQSSEAGTLAS